MSAKDAARYEQLYPGTGLPESQKEERMQREDFKHERVTDTRTGRNRGVVFSMDNPWLNSLPSSRGEQ
jgi:hypothetical protein